MTINSAPSSTTPKKLARAAATIIMASSLVMVTPVIPSLTEEASSQSDRSATTAWADELSDAKSELASQVEKLDALTAQIESLQSQIDQKSESATELESAILEKQEIIGRLSVFFYKNPTVGLVEYMLSAENVSEMMSRAEMLYGYSEDLARSVREEREMDAQLRDEIASISKEKDEQVAAQEEMQAVVADLKAKVDRLTAEQLMKLAAGSTFVTDFEDGLDGWRSGAASAYGGATDSMTPNPSRTATGAICNDYSVGVAIPMSWSNYRSYFGRKIEISYGGKSVIATVNDCGGMNHGARALDLQPGVWRAFGAGSCNGWGVRTVQYRFL